MVFKLVSAFGVLPANRYHLVKSLIALRHDWANYHIAYRVTQHQQKKPPNKTQATRLLAEKMHLICCLNSKLVLYRTLNLSLAIHSWLSVIKNTDERLTFDREKTSFNVSHQRQVIHN